MKATEFCYWLQGMFELANPQEFGPEQTKMIRQHLAMVFVHDIDPQAGGPEVQQKLNSLHGPSGLSGPSCPPGNPVYRC